MKKALLISMICFYGIIVQAQGCSDAGVCSVGNSFTEVKELKNLIETGIIISKAEADVSVISSYLTYSRNINNKFSVAGKVTYSQANGNFGTRGQFGDAFLIGNYKFEEKNSKQWSTLIAFKFPFSSSNLKINDYSIPLDYQASLGTYDAIVGIDYKYNKWNFNTSLQIPVINNNKNSYFREFSGTNDFVSTNLFKRKSDALFRASYTIKTTNNKFTFKPNILFIYHLGNDSFENIFGQREEIKKSEGLTINGNLITSYALNKKNSIELSLATPFVVRDIRPDGLTRVFTAGIIYKRSF